MEHSSGSSQSSPSNQGIPHTMHHFEAFNQPSSNFPANQREIVASNPAECKINPFFGQSRGYAQQQQRGQNFQGVYPQVPATMATEQLEAGQSHVFNNPYATAPSNQSGYNLPSNSMPSNEDFFFEHSNDTMFPSNKASVANMNCNNNNNAVPINQNQTLPNINMLSKAPLVTNDDQLLGSLDATPSPCSSFVSLQNFSQESPDSVEGPTVTSYLNDLLDSDVTKCLPSIDDVKASC